MTCAQDSGMPSRINHVGQVGNLRRIVNPPVEPYRNIQSADCQSAAGYHPAPQKSSTGILACVVFVCSFPTAIAATNFTYHIAADDPAPWPQILSSIGLTKASGGPANLFIVRNVAPGSVPQWMKRIEQGSIVVIEGESELADALGIKPSKKHVMVRSIIDHRTPKLSIVWETTLEILAFDLPKDATIFANEHWDGAPVMAAVHRGSGAAFWIAASPGEQG